MHRVSVLMPVYNGAAYLQEALKSILCQTFPDFEFLIIDDGSVDQSVQIIRSFPDPRIRLVCNERNMGLVYTLNIGLDLVDGEYIARMDCDDVSLPERLRKQVALLDQNPTIGVCGTWFAYFMGQSLTMRFPENDADIKRELLFHNCIHHPTVMMRTRVIRSHRIYYDANFSHTEDYDFWARLALVTNFYNIPEVLHYYRIHNEQICFKYSEQQHINSKIIQDRLRQMTDSATN